MNLTELLKNLENALAALHSWDKVLYTATQNEQEIELALKLEKNRLILLHCGSAEATKNFGANEDIRTAKMAELLAPFSESVTIQKRHRLETEQGQKIATTIYQHQRDLLRLAELSAAMMK